LKKHRNLEIYDFNKWNPILHFYSCKKCLQTFQERKKRKLLGNRIELNWIELIWKTAKKLQTWQVILGLLWK
jgi:hypothetical protein